MSAGVIQDSGSQKIFLLKRAEDFKNLRTVWTEVLNKNEGTVVDSLWVVNCTAPISCRRAEGNVFFHKKGVYKRNIKKIT